ncbi:MAG: hypothetical protein J7L08_00570 [Candidatus Aenigmarchaeota archaeon]|nr:hypothetical protein [Candidatus Aenigmarchaeota archaeon]
MEIKDINFVGNSEKEINYLKNLFEKYFPIEVIECTGDVEENDFFAKKEGSDEVTVYVGLIPRYPIKVVSISIPNYESREDYEENPLMKEKRNMKYNILSEKDVVVIDPFDINAILNIHFK